MRCYVADENGIVRIPRTARIAAYADDFVQKDVAFTQTAVKTAAATLQQKAAASAPTQVRNAAAPSVPKAPPLRPVVQAAPTVEKPKAASITDLFKRPATEPSSSYVPPSKMTVDMPTVLMPPPSASSSGAGGGGGGGGAVESSGEPLQAGITQAGMLSSPLLVGGLAGVAILLMFLFGGEK